MTFFKNFISLIPKKVVPIRKLKIKKLSYQHILKEIEIKNSRKNFINDKFKSVFQILVVSLDQSLY